MKKRYSKPFLTNSLAQRTAVPAGLPGVAGFVAGYAAVRAVTQAMKATPVKKLNSIQTQKW